MPYKNKEDRKKNHKKWCKNNPEKIKKYSKNRDPAKHRESQRKWYRNNPKKVKEINRKKREKNPGYYKNWAKNNPEKLREYERNRNKSEAYKVWRNGYMREYRNNRRKTDPRFKLNYIIGKSILNSLKINKNGNHWETIVNYTCNDLIKRLTKTMPEDYTWQNFLSGKLHIDHIIPIRAFIFDKPEDEGFKMCWSLYNLRLLPAKENRLKHDKITNPILLGLLITYNQNIKGGLLFLKKRSE